MSATWVVIAILFTVGVFYYLDRRAKLSRQVPIEVPLEVLQLQAARNAKDYARVVELGPHALASIPPGPMFDTWTTTTLRIMTGANFSLSRFAEAARCCEEILRFTDDLEIVSDTRALLSKAHACQVIAYKQLGDYESARSHGGQFLAAAQAGGSYDIAAFHALAVLTMLGEIAWRTGGDPEPFIARALALADSSACSEKDAAETYFAVAELCIKQRDLERAGEFLARGDSTTYAQTMSGGVAAIIMLDRLELDLLMGRAPSAPATLAHAKGLIPPGHDLPRLHHGRVASLVELHQGDLNDARRRSAANVEDYRSSDQPATAAIAAYVFARDLDDLGQASRADLTETIDLARSFGHHRHVEDLTDRLNRLS